MAGVTRGSTGESLECVFRRGALGDSCEAHCLLLSQIINVSPEQCPVTKPMCEACISHTRKQAFDRHPIFPSLIYQIGLEQLETGLDSQSRQFWASWIDRAETAILKQSRPAGSVFVPMCDVILCAEDDSPTLRMAINSILEQVDSHPILHLIDGAESPIDFGHMTSRWNVEVHRWPGPLEALDAATRIVESLRTPYLAVQSPDSVSEPLRLHLSIRALRESGAELFLSRVPEDGTVDATLPTAETLRTVIPSSLVCRRATLVDIGGPPSGTLDTESNFILKAIRQGRLVTTRPDPVLSWPDPLDPQRSSSAGPAQTLRVNSRQSAVSPLLPSPPRIARFPNTPVRCDVVLPFRGQLHYVREALDGLLQQERATPVIHLIDDATIEDTTEFLNEWSKHPQLRVYRNRENIGQFQSFNNVAPFWETDLVAVQDADDISLPHRLHWAAQMLRWSGADYFGGAVELFGDNELIRPVMYETGNLERIRRAEYRRSFYPQWHKTDYFLENPTAVFRTAMFRELGGYADFGNRLMNRTSLDTEFQLRCLFRGVRFAITQEVVTRYRVHPESATQDRETGWGTSARAESIRLLEERCRVFRGGDFDPRSFGALGRYTGITERWTGS